MYGSLLPTYKIWMAYFDDKSTVVLLPSNMEIMIPSHSANPVMKLSVECTIPEINSLKLRVGSLKFPFGMPFFQVPTANCWFQGGYHHGKTPALQELMSKSRFPWLGSNVRGAAGWRAWSGEEWKWLGEIYRRHVCSGVFGELVRGDCFKLPEPEDP